MKTTTGKRSQTPTRPSHRTSKARLAAMIEEATVDAYGEGEEVVGLYTLLEEHLALPFETAILGVTVTVERIDLTDRNQIVAICRRGRDRQRLPLADLPLPSPAPDGADWIEAYRQWIGEAEACA